MNQRARRLALGDCTRTFGGLAVVDRFGLVVESGELMALPVPSGCGESNTHLAIFGIHRVDGGSFEFDDRDVSDLPCQARKFGVLFQNCVLYPHMNDRKNIAFPLKVRKRDQQDIAAKVLEISELAHLPDLPERKPAQLSGGQRRAAPVRRPDVLPAHSKDGQRQ